MTFDEWLESKQPMFDEMFPSTQWPAINTFLLECYNVGYEKGSIDGYKNGFKDYPRLSSLDNF